MNKMSWLVYALLAAVFFSGTILGFKYLGERGLSREVILLYVFWFGFLFYLVHSLIIKAPLKPSGDLLLILAAIAVLSYLGNLANVTGLLKAPNPGYMDAVSFPFRIAIVTVLAIFLFGSELSLIKIIGAGVMIIGFLLLAI